MALRSLGWAMVLLLSLPAAGSAALIVVPPVPEQLVEGHTVFATIEIVPGATGEHEFAAAVAVLVRDLTRDFKNSRFPGVLWFNDQFVIEPEQQRRQPAPRVRFPCTGALIAVNRGDPVDQDPAGRWTLVNASYANESYFITDPNDHQWIVDLWNTTYGTAAWTVAIMNRQADSNTPDNGVCRGSRYTDDVRAEDPGDHGMDYPCDGCNTIEYNALLYFRLSHLRHQNVTKDHRDGSPDRLADVAGCHPSSTNAWRCPANDDAREGNSHAYLGARGVPFDPYDGAGNHGQSAECVDGALMDCHATFDIDIYYGYVPRPLLRTFWLVDTPGSDAPYHCHEDPQLCDPLIVSG